jgi:uncharacterized protein YhaN
VKEARQKSNTIGRNREKLAELSTKVSDFETEVASVLEACEMVSSGSCDADVHALAVSLENNRNTRAGLDTLQSEQLRLEVELNALKEQRMQRDEEQSKLFRSGFAEDEDAFRRNAQIWARKTECTTVICDTESRLRKAAGGDENYPAFIETLRVTDFLSVAQEKDLLAQKLAEIEGTGNELYVRLGELKKDLEGLETMTQRRYCGINARPSGRYPRRLKRMGKTRYRPVYPRQGGERYERERQRPLPAGPGVLYRNYQREIPADPNRLTRTKYLLRIPAGEGSMLDH